MFVTCIMRHTVRIHVQNKQSAWKIIKRVFYAIAYKLDKIVRFDLDTIYSKFNVCYSIYTLTKSNHSQVPILRYKYKNYVSGSTDTTRSATKTKIRQLQSVLWSSVEAADCTAGLCAVAGPTDTPRDTMQSLQTDRSRINIHLHFLKLLKTMSFPPIPLAVAPPTENNVERR